VAPTTLQRLSQVRKTANPDDTLDGDAIAAIEVTAADSEDFLKGQLSQLKRIIHGNDLGNWWDDIATIFGSDASLKSLLSHASLAGKFNCSCTAAESTGKVVYIAGPATGNIYKVRKADPFDGNKMPSFGVIISKDSPLSCKVQWTGEVSGIFSGLIPGRPYFVGVGGDITLTPMIGEVYIQKVGLALSESTLLLIPDLNMTRRTSS